MLELDLLCQCPPQECDNLGAGACVAGFERRVGRAVGDALLNCPVDGIVVTSGFGHVLHASVTGDGGRTSHLVQVLHCERPGAGRILVETAVNHAVGVAPVDCIVVVIGGRNVLGFDDGRNGVDFRRTLRTPNERQNLRLRAGVVGPEGRGGHTLGDVLVDSPLHGFCVILVGSHVLEAADRRRSVCYGLGRVSLALYDVVVVAVEADVALFVQCLSRIGSDSTVGPDVVRLVDGLPFGFGAFVENHYIREVRIVEIASECAGRAFVLVGFEKPLLNFIRIFHARKVAEHVSKSFDRLRNNDDFGVTVATYDGRNVFRNDDVFDELVITDGCGRHVAECFNDCAGYAIVVGVLRVRNVVEVVVDGDVVGFHLAIAGGGRHGSSGDVRAGGTDTCDFVQLVGGRPGGGRDGAGQQHHGCQQPTKKIFACLHVLSSYHKIMGPYTDYHPAERPTGGGIAPGPPIGRFRRDK